MNNQSMDLTATPGTVRIEGKDFDGLRARLANIAVALPIASSARLELELVGEMLENIHREHLQGLKDGTEGTV